MRPCVKYISWCSGTWIFIVNFAFDLYYVLWSYVNYFPSTSILRPVLTTLISKLAGNEQGFAMGMNNSYMSIGNVLGPLLAGLLFDVHIIYPFVLGLIVLLLTMVVSIRWKAPKNRSFIDRLSR